jgi:guanosine-3',5'-bis(diphosphate) 3'-pyrophosphohydrolase
MDLVGIAAEFARRAHEGQKRKFTGRPYIEHPGRVAARVSVYPGSTEAMVVAAWLHDVVEDTPTILDEVAGAFGPEVARLVGELTNPSNDSSLSRAERKAQDRARLSGVSREAKIIKLLDRIDNLQEVGDAPGGFRSLYAAESLALAEAIGDADAGLRDELIAAANRLPATP